VYILRYPESARIFDSVRYLCIGVRYGYDYVIIKYKILYTMCAFFGLGHLLVSVCPCGMYVTRTRRREFQSRCIEDNKNHNVIQITLLFVSHSYWCNAQRARSVILPDNYNTRKKKNAFVVCSRQKITIVTRKRWLYIAAQLL